MKLSNKIITLVGVSVLLVSIITSYIYYLESRKAAMNAGEEKAFAIIKTFDLTLTGDETDQVLQTFLDKLKNQNLEVEEFNIYKLDNDPKVIASIDPANIGKKADPEDLVAAKEDKTVPIIEKDIVDVTTPLHSNGKIVYVAGIQFSIADELAASNHLILTNLIATLILLILVMVIIWFLVRRILTGSLNVLVRFAERIATGDLSVDLEVLNNNRKDEFGILSLSFYHMVTNLKTIVKQISLSSGQLASSANQFLLISTQIGKTEQEIAVSVEEIARNAKDQSTSINESSTAIDEVAKGIGQIAMRTEDVSNASSSSLRQAENGKRIINETQHIIESLVSQSKESVMKIQLLGEKTQEIDQIIILIAEISSQTNLLALNASIEAARAGEQGRGFAVVANEVRKLAEQSRVASENVSEMIRSIQHETEAVMLQINQSSEKTEDGLAAVRNAGESFEQISGEVDIVNNQIINVSAIVEEISASSEEIAANIQSLVNNVEKSSEKAEYAAGATVKSLVAMQELLTSSQNLTELSKSMNQLLSNFKL
jgi:methyl-accepting chemotaxis protein